MEPPIRVSQQEPMAIIVNLTVTMGDDLGGVVSIPGILGCNLPDDPRRTHRHGASHSPLVIVIEDRLVSYDEYATTGGWDVY